jgi:hypothetical protein
MGTNRTRRKRTSESIKLDESIIEYLLYGTKPEKDTPGWELYISRHFEGHTGIIKKAWLEHRGTLLKEWSAAGRRGMPWAERILNNAK